MAQKGIENFSEWREANYKATKGRLCNGWKSSHIIQEKSD